MDFLSLDLQTLLIVCPLVFLGGFVDSIAGGGGLISLPAYMIAGLPVHLAIGTNKLSSAMGTFVATLKYAMSGFVPWRLAFVCLFTSIAGSFLGARCALLIDAKIFTFVMLFLLPATLVFVTKTRVFAQRPQGYSTAKTMLICMVITFFLGMYEGCYGPGTGTFLIIGMVALAKMDVMQANGLSKSLNLPMNVGALCVFILNGKTLFALGLIAGLFGIVGNWLGATYCTRRGFAAVRPIMAVVIVLFWCRVAYDYFLN